MNNNGAPWIGIFNGVTYEPLKKVQQIESSTFLTYDNDQLGITLQYPNDWERKDLGNCVQFVSPLESNSDKYREGLMITVIPSNSLSLDDQVRIRQNELQMKYQLYGTYINQTTLSGITAKEFHYSFYVGGIFVETKAIFALVNNNLIIVDYHAAEYHKYLKIADRMISTIKIDSNLHEISSPASISHINNTNDYSIYENHKYGISLKYPSNWEKMEINMTYSNPLYGLTRLVRFNSPPENQSDRFPENLEIGLFKLPSYDMSLNEFANIQINILRQNMFLFTLIESSVVAINPNVFAHRIIFDYVHNTIPVRVFLIMMRQHSSEVICFSFDMEYSKSSLYIPVLQDMIRSFKKLD